MTCKGKRVCDEEVVGQCRRCGLTLGKRCLVETTCCKKGHSIEELKSHVEVDKGGTHATRTNRPRRLAMVAAYERSRSLEIVGEEFGVCGATVLDALHREGVETHHSCKGCGIEFRVRSADARCPDCRGEFERRQRSDFVARRVEFAEAHRGP